MSDTKITILAAGALVLLIVGALKIGMKDAPAITSCRTDSRA
jgi:hypothetical protein